MKNQSQSQIIKVKMRNFAAMLGTALCLTAASAFATPQAPDIFIYKGEKYYNHSDLMEPFLKKHPEIRLPVPHSALWKGYHATYEIVNNELLLKKVEGADEKSVLTEFLSAAKAKGSTLKIDWFTGRLDLRGGEIMYGGFAPLHSVEIRERHLFLEFKNGVLVKETRMNYLEYLEYLHTNFGDRVPDYPQILEKLTHYAATEKGDGSEFITKLKAEYQKAFREPISDFELAVTRVVATTLQASEKHNSITVSRTLNGARAVYVCYYGHGVVDSVAAELTMAEWLAYVRVLRKNGVDAWAQKPQSGLVAAVEIYSIGKNGKEERNTFFAPNPSQGRDALKKAVVAMEARIRRDPATSALEAKLDAEHRRIYKAPIPDFERSLKEVCASLDPKRPIAFRATRTANGALMTFISGYYPKSETRSVEFSAAEWLSFAKTVSKCNVGEWKELYYIKGSPDEEREERYSRWTASFLFTDRAGVTSQGGTVHPPGWNEFKKAVDGIEARVAARKD